MPKDYDVAKRFTEVARRAEEMKRKKPIGPDTRGKSDTQPVESVHNLRESFRKQFPNSGGKKGDVNLPIGPRK